MTAAGLVTTAEACEYLGCSLRNFWRVAAEYRLRPARRLARQHQWRIADLDRVIEARTRARR